MFLADLHIHSHYARATSKQCEPSMLSYWAARKGLDLIGTGDFTHPGWREELRTKLMPTEDGLYTLKPEFSLPTGLPNSPEHPRFLISGEISSIYKKHGKVRKVHNLILLPSLEDAERLSQRLEQIGNLHSDGRPILGLDSRDLLEITLECCPEAMFIPAHIWTPHFSLFGAYSGFDSIEECFEDLTPHIHALETGLSSDPPMNWRLSALDRFHLISNSDAHSPANLAREANLFCTELSYSALKQALETPHSDAFCGTLEFFPEEGKYHFDGHRACKVCLSPAETKAHQGICPVCGRPVTVGVFHRVDALADRPEGYIPANAKPFTSMIPLPEVIASVVGMGVNSNKVQHSYEMLLRALGPELSILQQTPIADIARVGGPYIAESIRWLRQGEVNVSPGYDGEYGKVHILDETDLCSLSGQISFLPTDAFPVRPKEAKQPTLFTSAVQASQQEDDCKIVTSDASPLSSQTASRYGLNDAQWQAASAMSSPIVVSAGPGTGKTRTLVCRIAYLIEHEGVHPSQITAVTFTNKAAKEMRERLEKHFGDKRLVRAMHIGTFHALCLQMLDKWKMDTTILSEQEALSILADLLQTHGISLSPQNAYQRISRRKNGHAEQDDPLTEAFYADYQEILKRFHLIDYDDVLIHALTAFTGKHRHDKSILRWFHHLFVDEFQDINDLQYQLVQAWSAKSATLFLIGDPDQAIYGFRGSTAHCFERFLSDYPHATQIRLFENYRSTPQIVQSALSLLPHRNQNDLLACKSKGADVRILRVPDAFSEAVFIAKEINRLVGGIGMLESHTLSPACAHYGFSDIAILYRTHRQAEVLEQCLQKEGIPYTIVGRSSFLEDPQVRKAIAWCRFICYPQDKLAGALCLQQASIPPATIPSILQVCPDEMDASAWQTCFQTFLKLDHSVPLATFVQQWQLLFGLAKSKPAKFIAQWISLFRASDSPALQQLQRMAVMYRNMPEFLQSLTLGLEPDLQRSSGLRHTPDSVTLMTFHGAKGLEYPVVLLCGVNQQTLPLQIKGRPCDIEEERRLLYVGMTRAQERLTILTSPQTPSPFLSSLHTDGIVTEDAIPTSERTFGKQLTFL